MSKLTVFAARCVVAFPSEEEEFLENEEVIEANRSSASEFPPSKFCAFKSGDAIERATMKATAAGATPSLFESICRSNLKRRSPARPKLFAIKVHRSAATQERANVPRGFKIVVKSVIASALS